MCDLKLPFGENNYPVFNLPPEISTKVSDNIEYLKLQCIEGMQKRYELNYLPEDKRDEETDGKVRELSERIDYELGIISKTGFNDYFLIVSDFMLWAREQGIPVGPGRGSGAGCLVAFLLGITDIDPLRFGLLFERFLNRSGSHHRISISIFACAWRSEVIEYVRDKYGRDCVANIITFGTFGLRW